MIRGWIVGALVLTTAVAVGATAGALTGSDADDGGTTVASAGLHRCPDEEPYAVLHSQDRVLLTGRDAAGTWVQLRAPQDHEGRVWLRAEHVEPDGPLQNLPVVECAEATPSIVALLATDDEDDEDPVDEVEEEQDEEVEEPEPDEAPVIAAPGETGGGSTGSSPEGSDDQAGGGSTGGGSTGGGSSGGGPSSGGSSGSGSSGGGSSGSDPDPPPPPPPAPPTVESLTRSVAEITEDWGSCPANTAHTSDVTASVNAPAGVQSVTLDYSLPKRGGGTYTVSKPMTLLLSGGGWRATVGPIPVDTIEDEATVPVTWSVTVVDQQGRSTTATPDSGQAITARNRWVCFG